MIVSKTHSATIVYSQKKDGDMKKNSFDNLLKRLKIDPNQVVTMNQVHSAYVIDIDHKNDFNKLRCDAILTEDPKKTLVVYTADCLPITFFDKDSHLFGAIHAGYKGLLLEILENTLKKIENKNISKKSLVFNIGPSIEQCCYSVSEKRAGEFESKHPESKCVERTEDSTYLNLKKYAIHILTTNGVNKKNIHSKSSCTHCTDKFFSFRNEKERSKLNCTIIKRND